MWQKWLAIRSEQKRSSNNDEKADLELQKLRLESAKLRLEKRSLQQRINGRERSSPWQKAQIVAIILSVPFSAFSVLVAVRTSIHATDDARRRDFQVAVEHFGKGYPGAAIELVRLEGGLQVLVYSLDPTGERETNWPHVTQVALDQIQKTMSSNKNTLTQDQMNVLRTNQNRNQYRVNERLAAYNSASTIQDKNAILSTISDLLCIQNKLWQITGYVPPGWQETQTSAEIQLGGKQHC